MSTAESGPEAPTPRPIGTLNERPLHASLKDWYAQPGDLREVDVSGYVVDIVRGELLVEIQTRNFAAISRKLKALADTHQVRLVHPIAHEKWIVKLGEDGVQAVGRRKSPKKGEFVDVFHELVYIPHLLAKPSFSVDVVLTREDELRRRDPSKGWRRGGWVVQERRLLEVVACTTLHSPDDAVSFVPNELDEPFTTADLARSLGRPRRLAQRMTYCLRRMGAILAVGKQGRSILYART